MCKFKSIFSAVFVASVLTYSGQSLANTFKSSKFLTYSNSAQQNYITTSAMMAGVIATQNKREQASCIDRWIAQHNKNGYQPVIAAMRKFPDYHPQGVIMAVLKKACGSFKY